MNNDPSPSPLGALAPATPSPSLPRVRVAAPIPGDRRLRGGVDFSGAWTKGGKVLIPHADETVAHFSERFNLGPAEISAWREKTLPLLIQAGVLAPAWDFAPPVGGPPDAAAPVEEASPAEGATPPAPPSSPAVEQEASAVVPPTADAVIPAQPVEAGGPAEDTLEQRLLAIEARLRALEDLAAVEVPLATPPSEPVAGAVPSARGQGDAPPASPTEGASA